MSPQKRGKSSSRGSRGKGKQSREFWGPEPIADAEEASAVAVGPVRPADHPTALIQSLGPIPLPNGAVAQHYFEVIYERAAALAVALAASADLIEFDTAD